MQPEDMHWHFWEAVVMEAQDMWMKKIIPTALITEVEMISTLTRETGVFSEDLRKRACAVAESLAPFQEEWEAAVFEEYVDTNRKIEAAERGGAKERKGRVWNID